jgi:hypothetical protein
VETEVKYFSEGSEGFVLLSLAGQSCAKIGCSKEATHIVIGKESELIEFFCFEHGWISQYALEEKYQFDKENRKTRSVKLRQTRSEKIKVSSDPTQRLLDKEARRLQHEADKAQHLAKVAQEKLERIRDGKG